MYKYKSQTYFKNKQKRCFPNDDVKIDIKLTSHFLVFTSSITCLNVVKLCTYRVKEVAHPLGHNERYDNGQPKRDVSRALYDDNG